MGAARKMDVPKKNNKKGVFAASVGRERANVFLSPGAENFRKIAGD